LARHEEREFADGEHKARPLVSTRGRDVCVVQSLYQDDTQSVNDKLCRLLFFIAALRDNGAHQITAVVPYLAYARKDRQTKPRDPVTTRYVAQLLEAVGVDRVVAVEVHNVAAFQNAFRCPSVHVDTGRLFAEYAQTLGLAPPVVVVSPDPGGVKRAQRFRDRLKALGLPAQQAFVDKRRSGDVLSGETMVGIVAGATVLIFDDLIASGSTMARAASLAHQLGARSVMLLATHGLFTDGAETTLRSAPITRVIVTDSVPPFRLTPAFAKDRLDIVSICPMIAESIRRLHHGGSIAELLGDDESSAPSAGPGGE
jgi:ribose-phosphate pyrophosphokinase